MTKPFGHVQSQKHEKRLAAKYEGSVNAGSGSFWSRKGDVRTDKFIIEHKYTAATKSLSIKADWLIQIIKTGLMENKIPVLAFHLGGRNYVILTEDDFDAISEAAFTSSE